VLPQDTFLTPSAVRTLRRAAHFCDSEDLAEFAGQLVIALLDEESVAGGLLRSAGLSADALRAMFNRNSAQSSAPDLQSAGDVTAAVMIQELPDTQAQLVAEARRIARQELCAEGVSSEHLLAATLQFDTPICRTLQQHGVTLASVFASRRESEWSADPIAVSFSLEAREEQSDDDPCDKSVHEAGKPDRVIDACMNRAREGIRVLEDYARFMMDDRMLVQSLKDLRHRLAASERRLDRFQSSDAGGTARLAERNVTGDVGTECTGALEQARLQPVDIVEANARRVQEALRSLEEFGKLMSPAFSTEMKQLRYRAYELHRRMRSNSGDHHQPPADCRRRLQRARVCVLISESGCHHPWKQVVTSCLSGGADMIQLREKHLDDRDLVLRATWLTEACHASGALCIVNDRADIARLSGADGVHLGQTDCRVSDARRILGAHCLIGLSTHTAHDMESADALAADYLGVGPVFPSVTKEFDSIAGLPLLQAAANVTKPWFAIGGIDQDRIAQLADSGATRIAVSAAAIASERPDEIVQALRKQLSSV
jgi:thiamine-phosphate pyrophosphorylase